MRCWVLLFLCTPVACWAADEKHPFANVRVGDFVVYTVTSKGLGVDFETSIQQHVVDISKDVVTIVTFRADIPNQQIPDRIDLKKPYEPAAFAALPKNAEVKSKLIDSGTEKRKAAGKEFNCKWEKHSLEGTIKNKGTSDIKFQATIKIWRSADALMEVVRAEVNGEFAGVKAEKVVELQLVGFQPPPKKK